MGKPNQAAYNASKHAVVALTRCAALENAAAGIRVNAICPGFVETDMIGEFEGHAARAGMEFDAFKAAMTARSRRAACSSRKRSPISRSTSPRRNPTA